MVLILTFLRPFSTIQVFVDDLMRGLIALQEAAADQLIESGNCSFTLDLFSRGSQLHPTPHAPCAMLYVVPRLNWG